MKQLLTLFAVSVLLVSLLFHPLSSAHAQGFYARVADTARAQGQRHRKIRATFAIPRALAAPVHFWQDIYSKYDRNQVLIHDTDHLEIVYATISLADISRLGDPFAAFPPEVQEARRARVRETMDRVREALLRLTEDPKRPGQSPLEQRIVKLFAPYGATPEQFRAAATNERLRSQTGLKDRFRAGLIASGRYLPQIEAIFAEEQIPWEMSRLVFVESMFDLRAYSKAGASGIWQFMPGTARLMGLQNTRFIDERNDPTAASHGAARLLKKNFQQLGTWPLAINAYNSGPGNLLRAVRELGTTSIERIINSYRGASYGFASRNFYCEFLAALHTYEQRETLFGKLTIDPPLQYDTVVTTGIVALPDLAKHAAVALETLWQLNPGLTPAVYDGSVPLPAGVALKVPLTQGKRFLAVMEQLNGAVATSSGAGG
ncbi:MAG: lytic transglycosylase domain-containing protein [Deltaproteobacteria bacterium]|nr:lytic transglycosylase domain-containing protein [Deltaproteobacteria bacterium]